MAKVAFLGLGVMGYPMAPKPRNATFAIVFLLRLGLSLGLNSRMSI